MKNYKRLIPLILVIVMLLTNTTKAKAVERVPIPVPDSVEYVAEMCSPKITVNGTKIYMQACTVGADPNLYIKVRDLANSLNKTNKKFNFTYNTKKDVLTINTGKTYKAVGGENKKDKNADLYYGITNRFTKVYVNKTKEDIKVYFIDNEPYLSLNSLSKVANFSVSSSKNIFKIDTKKGYNGPKEESNTATLTPVISLEDGEILKNPFPNAKLIDNPQTVEDAENIIAYMYLYNIMEYSFEVPYGYTEAGAKDLLNLRERAVDNRIDLTSSVTFGGWLRMVESYYPESSAEYLTKVTYSLDYGEVITDEEVMMRNKEYLTKVQATVQGLIDNGKLTADMTQTQKAQVLFNWVTENVVYDHESNNEIKNGTGFNPDCQTGRAALLKGTAVCNGYTALYNLMCRFVGIYQTYGMFGEAKGIGHAWTYQILDEKPCMTDATWGSGYFAKSAEYFKQSRKWDSKEYATWSNAPGIY